MELFERARRLRLAMAHAGLDQTALAERMGLSQQAISLIVNGKRESRKHLGAIAKALGAPLSWIIDGSHPPKWAVTASAPAAAAAIVDQDTPPHWFSQDAQRLLVTLDKTFKFPFQTMTFRQAVIHILALETSRGLLSSRFDEERQRLAETLVVIVASHIGVDADAPMPVQTAQVLEFARAANKAMLLIEAGQPKASEE